MKKLTLTLAALVTIALMSLSASSAEAQGIRVYVSTRPAYRSNVYAYAPRPVYYGSRYNAATVYVGDHYDVWHDTSHYHYRRPSLVQHGNHYDYVPGGYELHETGHWDHVH